MDDDRAIETCELGPIRPPSEAASLLLRVTRNCPWNKCAFCAVYKNVKFSRRTEEELIQEIDLLAAAAQRIKQRAAARGEIGAVSSTTTLEMMRDPAASEEERRIAFWLHRGGEHVFLQDADSLVLPAKRLVPVLEHLYRSFPTINRVTTYSRSRTLVARSPEQLAALRDAGLTRIHVGVESGHDPVLEMVSKGCRAEHHIEGGKRAVEAGFEVCCYVMPGLGGRDLSEGHSRDTALVLKEIDPQHVRLRTLWIDPGSPLRQMWQQETFALLEEDEVVAEIRTMLKGLRGASGQIVSDHDRNLLMEIEGHLTADADHLDRLIARFLELPQKTRDAFVVARRSGYYRTLDRFLADPDAEENFAPIAENLRQLGQGSLVNGMLAEFRRRSI